MIQLAASSPSSTCHHRRLAGPRNSGLVAFSGEVRGYQPVPKTKTSSPDSDRSAISRSSSLAGSPVAAISFMRCSSPVSVSSLLKNMAPCRIHTRRPPDDQLGRSVAWPSTASVIRLGSYSGLDWKRGDDEEGPTGVLVSAG